MMYDSSKKTVKEKKSALITGITGQDGSYLAELLLDKGYEVHGIIRRSSQVNTTLIENLINNERNRNLTLHYGDLTHSTNILRIIKETQPSEIYNLAAQSHVKVSFDSPEYTAQADALGPLRILEAVRILELSKSTRIYQASTSELYGLVQNVPQNEDTPFYPRSPYGVAKLYAYWITVNYRESYGMFACNGILFNHESPRRGETFVTRKITRGLCRIEKGLQENIQLGNIDSLRDWGHARDYVEMQWRMLQQEKPEDYVIGTGIQTSVRKFIEISAEKLGWGGISWEGKNAQEIGRRIDNGNIVIKIDPKFYRPAEVESLLGDATKAHSKLGWKPTCSLDNLIEEMLENDLKLATKEKTYSEIN